MATVHVHDDHRNLYHKYVVRGLSLITATGASGYKGFVHIAPTPVLPWLKGLHDRMLGLMEVFGSVLVLGRVAATNVAADQTFPQVDPGIAHLQTFLASFAARFDLANFFYVRTRCLFVWHALPQE
jgi:hypothetical protein